MGKKITGALAGLVLSTIRPFSRFSYIVSYQFIKLSLVQRVDLAWWGYSALDEIDTCRMFCPFKSVEHLGRFFFFFEKTAVRHDGPARVVTAEV